MAVTTAASISGSIPQVWSDELLAQAENTTFWHNLEGEPGSSKPITRKDDLTREAGDTIKYDAVLALSGAGMTGDSSLLEGNEEALKIRQASFQVESLQHAVRFSKKAAVLNVHDLGRTGSVQLSKWLAGKIDASIFTELATPGGSVNNLPTSAQWFAGSATAINGVSATGPATPGAASGGTLTLRDLTEIRAYARSNNKIEPIMDSDGQEYFGIVCHPYTIMSLKRDDTQWAQAQRDAQLRGPNNPLFTGAAGMYDGVIIYESNRVPVASDGASSNPVSRNIFFGANALSRGYAYYPDMTYEAFSYGQEVGVAVYAIYGQAANIYDFTSAGGASAANKTAVGHLVAYASAAPPSA